MSKKEKSTFSHFFKEDAENVQDIIHSSETPTRTSDKTVEKQVIPKISSSKEVSEAEFKAHWQQLRSFLRNGDNFEGLPADFWPVVMNPAFTHSMTATDYPLWVADEAYEGGDFFCLPLKELIARSLNEIGPGENDASILKTNSERLLQIANLHLENNKPQLFNPSINQILDALEKELDVSGEDADTFKSDLLALKNTLPQTGVLLPFSNHILFQLLEAAMVTTLGPNRKKLKHEILVLKSKLTDLLRVEREKGPERKNPDELQDSLSFVDSMMKFDTYSSLLPDGGSELMGKDRAERIAKVLKDLDSTGEMMDQSAFLFTDESLYQNIEGNGLFENAQIKIFEAGKGAETVGAAFDKQMIVCSTFFAAKRIGELELENNYVADVHDVYFEHFDWQGFTTEELNSCPHFVLIGEATRLLDVEFVKLSNLISDNIPIKIFALKRDHFDDHSQKYSEKEKVSLHAQAELGAMMLSHKNIYVTQATSITPANLFKGFTEGLSAFAPALFHVMDIDANSHENPLVWTSAAVEGRDFPGFTFKGLLGTPWGSRFEVDNNPQPALPWPIHILKIIDENREQKDAEFPFTFADQAVLKPEYQHYYLPVSSSYWSDDLIPVTDYLKNSIEENIGKVPFIWMMDSENELHKVALSWPIVIATQERLDFWRFLQENCGISNYHVSQAVENAKADLEAAHRLEIDQLKAAHEKEIQSTKEEEAGKVMENLTAVLLDLDTSNLVVPDKPASGPKTNSKKPDSPEEIIEEDDLEPTEETANILSNDPYIDTALCTTCDECTGLNKEMFKYDADKKAYIADATAGTFKQLVEAAELCPVGIIHPGSPLNKDEPDLESLISRAEKFN